MGVDPAPPRPPPPSEADFSRMFDDAMRRSNNSSSTGSKSSMTRDEQDKFLSAMRDPEFRSLLSDYMAEISDPANRTETEQYLAQLESEQKVPADKQLVRPTPGFVVKSKWREAAAAAGASTPHLKLFVNVCSSDKLQPPSSSPVTQPATGNPGTSWHLPYSVGPERLEKDKGGASAVTFDVCFHPTTLAFAKTQRAFRDMVVNTCLDAVEGILRDTHRKPGDRSATAASVSRDFHVLKGVAYKSGEPVTMCLRKPAAEGSDKEKKKKPVAKTGARTSSSKSSSGATASTTAETSRGSISEKPIDVVPKNAAAGSVDERLKLDLAKSDDISATSSAPEPLMREVSSTKTESAAATTTAAQRTPLLRKIAFKLVYRGKFELLHHMQAEHENVLPVDRNRPKELVLEMEFPTLASAAGVDLDVSEQALKLSAKGYEPLSITLPFPVLEAKGSAKFDKKARKLVVTLPVQPPPEPKKSAMVIVEDDQEDDDESQEEESDDRKCDDAAAYSGQGTVGAPQPSILKQEEPPSVKTRADDAFAMLRETAIMVQHDPLYMPLNKQITTPAVAPAADAEVAAFEFESYDDLPPLESCSEDEGDEEDADLVLVEASPTANTLHTAPSADDSVAAKAAPFSTKETATRLSFLVDVAGIDATSVQLEVPTPTSFTLRFAAERADSSVVGDRESKREHYELLIDALEHEVEPSQAEFDVASENMVVILTKRAAAAVPPVTESTPLASIPPVMRFQNHLLYELD